MNNSLFSGVRLGKDYWQEFLANPGIIIVEAIKKDATSIGGGIDLDFSSRQIARDHLAAL